jgi:predicted transglutaminase-like cysteine proteinase
MRPKPPNPTTTDDLFRNRLSNIINQRHEFVRLAGLIDWARFDGEYGALYAEEGRPGLPTRLMVGLHLLKHIKALSDEQVCAQWVENPYFQAFCGEIYFRHESPLDRSSMSRWRGRIGPDKLEAVLAETIAAALKGGAMAPKHIDRDHRDADRRRDCAMLFCKAHAGECADKGPTTTRVEMTDQRLDQLRAVQDEVNRRIDPTGAVEVAWHYAANGKGTCVQYAMEKRRQLIALGWPAASLQLATVTTRQGEGHLVLVAATSQGELVLDNLRHDITPWQALPYRWIARQQGASLGQWVSINANGGA